MLFAMIGLVVGLMLVVLVVVLTRSAKTRIITNPVQPNNDVLSQMRTGGQPRVTVTVDPLTVESTGQMSVLAQGILKSMGGAEGILARPEVQAALRNAAQHPGVTTTVTTSYGAASGMEAADPAVVRGGADPFAPGTSPFAAPPAAASAGQGELGVANVLSLPSTTFDGSQEMSLELDAIGAPKRRVTATVASGQTEEFPVGSRVYVRLDPQNADRVTLLSASLGGNTLGTGPNRLDPMVLGPQLLRNGATGSGVVKSAARTDGGSGGAGMWKLELEVTPERGWPYRAELLTGVSTPEKAARLCVVGAVVPVRYDPDDPKTMCIDVVALGYANPPASSRG